MKELQELMTIYKERRALIDLGLTYGEANFQLGIKIETRVSARKMRYGN
jgi:hypothetical protein